MRANQDGLVTGEQIDDWPNRRAGHYLQKGGELVKTRSGLIIGGLELIGRGLYASGSVRRLYIW